MAKFSIQSLVKEAQRELAMRKQVYPRRVGQGKMRGAEADMLIEMLAAIIETLRFCENNEAAIREFFAVKGETTS